MNLGDGLLFELENGKPKLILLNRGEKVQKKPVKSRPRLPSVLSCRQPSRLDTPRTEEQPIRKPTALNGRSQNKQGRGGATVRGRGQTVTSLNTQENHAPVKEVKTNAKVKPAKSQNVKPNRKPEERSKNAELQVKPSIPSAALSDSVSCLTNEQLQQILSTVQTNNAPPRTEEVQADCHPESKVRETKETEAIRGGTQTVNAPDNDKPSGGLFKWVEERPSEDRAALEAKRAQWKKELDEQLALKLKIHGLAPPRVQGEEDSQSLVAVRSSVSHKDLPAAIRSSLRVGESAPVEEAELTMEQKLQQRRRWLQELDKQREETSERKRLEKLQQRQTEDQHLWASHFDSLHRPPLIAPLLPRAERAEVCSSVDRDEAGGSSSLSQWEEGSVRASVDTFSSGGHTSRASHLRTMTSLLDPAEIEERERRRLKQLEQQRAIELQVEERQRRRDEEEARKKREEEEEERRVQQERERLQRQYERDALRERHKEPSSPEAEPPVRANTESPLQSSIQLYPNLKGSGLENNRVIPHLKAKADKTVSNQEESPEPKAGPTPVNHHRDTAVQTEDVHISESLNPESVREAPDRAQVLQMLQKGFGADVYEPFARTERSTRDQKRPEWNTQRPSRRFVPASKRYPEELQRQRQESRLKRQAQLLSLQRNPTSSHNLNPTTEHEQDRSETHRASQAEMAEQITERGRSPVHSESPAPGFLPYVRTDEVFNQNSQDSEAAPPLLQKTQRQQEIIRGLAQLREGLLQKQRELESDLSRSRLDDHLRPVSTLTSRREL